jgi:hypothetical protein
LASSGDIFCACQLGPWLRVAPDAMTYADVDLVLLVGVHGCGEVVGAGCAGVFKE